MRVLHGVGAGVVAAALLAAAGAWAAGAPEDAAQTACEKWLALTDGGKYGESWDTASAPFKAAVKREQWTQAMTQVRTPLGAVKSRKLQSRTATRTLPGAPDGQYVVILYDTSFAEKPTAVETVTAAAETDGTWRVAGYFIR